MASISNKKAQQPIMKQNCNFIIITCTDIVRKKERKKERMACKKAHVLEKTGKSEDEKGIADVTTNDVAE